MNLEPAGADLRYKKTKVDGRRATGWSDYQLSRVLGCARPTVTRWRNAVLYPDIRTIKKIEKVFGWPAAQQIDLIPMTGYDMRWSLVFNEILKEWTDATPRDTPVDDLENEARTRKLDPSRPVGPRRNPPRPPSDNM